MSEELRGRAKRGGASREVAADATPDLDRRSVDVLRSLIEEFISSGDPVGSRTLSKSPRFACSAATIRNIMADLEEAGHLCQPHTSAGRVPTEKGFRWYVDHLRAHSRLPQGDEELIRESFETQRGELDAILDVGSKLLARLTHYTGVIVSPRFESAVLAHIDFVKLAPGRLLVILATTGGAVQHKVIETDADYGADELSRFARYAAETFKGLTLGEVRARIQEVIQQEIARYDELIRGALDVAARTFLLTSEPAVHIQGELNLLSAPEFSDVSRLRDVLVTFQDREKLLRVLDEVVAGGGLQVIIGSEAPVPGFAGISVVSSSYRSGDGTGALGVIGPTRMDYDRTVTVVDRIAEALSEHLADGHADPSRPDGTSLGGR